MGQSVPARLGRLHREIVASVPGLTSAEYQAFLCVADNEGLNQRQVVEQLELPQPTVSRALSRLNGEAYGLIECEENGRQLAMRVSPKGKQLLARLAVLLGCICMAPAASAILSQFEIEPMLASPAPGYDVCTDPNVFSCDIS